jgi:hypothetical protein
MPALSKAPAARKQVTSPIDGNVLYPLKNFYDTAGVGRSTVNRAARLGIVLNKRHVGRRSYVWGQDGIDWLLALAEAE